MSVQAWEDIVFEASILINKLDRNGSIFDSNHDEIVNRRIARCIDDNKLDIVSLLYNILNFDDHRMTTIPSDKEIDLELADKT